MPFNPVEVGYLKIKSILGTSLISDIDEWAKSLVEEITNKFVSYSEDTFAKRPAAGHANRLFFASDTGVLYKDTGTEWKAIPYPNAGSATGTAPESEVIGTSLSGGYTLWYVTFTVGAGGFNGQIKRKGGGEVTLSPLELPVGKWPMFFMLRPGETWSWIKTAGGTGTIAVSYVGNPM